MRLAIKGFDWDEGNLEKCQKHGVSIREIEQVFTGDNVWNMPDAKHSYLEDRLIAIAPVVGRLYLWCTR